MATICEDSVMWEVGDLIQKMATHSKEYRYVIVGVRSSLTSLDYTRYDVVSLDTFAILRGIEHRTFSGLQYEKVA